MPDREDRSPQARLRRTHERAVFHAVRTHPGSARTELAVRTGLSAQAISGIVRSLLDAGLIEEVPLQRRGGPGPAPMGLALAPQGALAVGFGIERDSVTGVVLDLGGAVHWRHSHRISSDETAEDTLGSVRSVVLELLDSQEWAERRERFCGLGVSLCGPLDLASGTLAGPSSLPNWQKVDVLAVMGSPHGLPVILDNNATAAAVGIDWETARRRPFLYCHWGFSIGGGLVLEDGVYRGLTGNAIELGHVLVDPLGRPCSCGRIGCLETEASLGALIEKARPFGTFETIEELMAAAPTSEEVAGLLRRAAEQVADGLLSAVNLVDVDEVVLGGEHFYATGQVLVPTVKARVETQAFRRDVSPVRVSTVGLAEEATALGAAAATFHALLPAPAEWQVSGSPGHRTARGPAPVQGRTSRDAVATRRTIEVGRTLPADLDELASIDLVEHGTVMMRDYAGASDLSGKVWLFWDEQYFYLLARIVDDVFWQPYQGSDIYSGDSVQFSLAPDLPGATNQWYEYGLALTPVGPQLYRWIAPHYRSAATTTATSGLVEGAQVSVVREGTVTTYQSALAWSELQSIGPDQGAFSFSFLVNDNDGSGRKGWIQWGGGIGTGKDSNQFLPVEFLGEESDALVRLLPLASCFNNVGISSDGQTEHADLDRLGASYSAEALAAVGLGPGARVNLDGVTYQWPAGIGGTSDNLVPDGGAIRLDWRPGSTRLGLLGCATEGRAQCEVTVVYADGSHQRQSVGFSDWTLNGGTEPSSFGNRIVAAMPYRNRSWGAEDYTTYVYAQTVPLQRGKVVIAVRVSAMPQGGTVHVFAIGTD